MVAGCGRRGREVEQGAILGALEAIAQEAEQRFRERTIGLGLRVIESDGAGEQPSAFIVLFPLRALAGLGFLDLFVQLGLLTQKAVQFATGFRAWHAVHLGCSSPLVFGCLGVFFLGLFFPVFS
ncbi:MAG: hypothetical protein ACLPKB_20520 [Xanthobacteraceae bacterium]